MNEDQRARQLELAAGGDADALQRLIVLYHGPLRSAVERCVAADCRSRIDADDVLQQAYIAAFKSMDGHAFDGPAGFYKWLKKIALNQLKDAERKARCEKRHVRREGSVGYAPCSSYPGLIDRVASSSSAPSRRLTLEEEKAALMTALARLSDAQRTVVIMRIMEGRTAQDVADHLGKNVPAVHTLLHRGLVALRESLESFTS